jgi:uncharacterized membrane protein YgdD (TMEM256/DUF423 family)
MRYPALFFGIGSALGAVAVALGALGAHALRAELSDSAMHAFETGVHYQFMHALALCVVALWIRGADADAIAYPTIAAGLFIAGTLLFSGSLYALSLGGPRWLGPITPIGGLALIFGWLVLAYGALRRAF